MSAYYNEIDPYCAQWLRNLIAAGLIAPGDVDERDIRDVRPDDLSGYAQCHFFAGIGGWSYALHLAGWPDDRPVWTGSCPCQPFSVAGNQVGFDDPRHLWPEFRRLIAERHPPVVFGEQVSGASAWLRLVRSDLEALAFAVGAIPIQAASAGAHHFRDRYWFVADSDGGKPSARRRDHGEVCGLSEAECEPKQRAAVSSGGCASGRARSVAHDDGQCPSQGLQRSREQCGTSGHTQDRLGSLANGTGKRSDWGQNTPEQGGWFSAQIADIDGASFIECPDGKWRRLPPPRVRWLGTGISARVAKLRAFGNSIDPRPAAAFIGAYLDCLPSDTFA